VIVSNDRAALRLARILGPSLLLFVAYDLVVVAVYVWLELRWAPLSGLPMSLFGSALAVFLSVRITAAYGRWWEARTLWGSAVNNSRSFARGVLTMLPPGDPARGVLVRAQVAWAHALRLHLRQQFAPEKVAPHVFTGGMEEVEAAANPAVALQGEIGHTLADAYRRGAIDSIRLAALDRTLCALADAQGGLERIKNTPIPRHYRQFPRVFVTGYCLLLPIGLVENLLWLTPLGSSIIGLALLSLDQIGRDLESPFANSQHDVPMDAITRTIEIDLRQLLGEHDQAPEPAKPVDGVLM